MDVTIDEVLSLWKEDAKIDETRIPHEIIRVPMLHAKYLEYYIYFKRVLAKAEASRNKMGWQKRRYFRGEFSQDDLERHGWSQWNGLKPSASELNQLLEFDKDMNDLDRVVAEYKGAVAGTEYIMNQLKGREYALKTLVDYQKWVNGG